MSGAPATPSGETDLMFEHIKESLERIEKTHAKEKGVLHERINGVEGCINKEIKPDLHKNKADVEWLTKGFWTLTGMGISALLLITGVIISSWIGG
jgi:hypothetical protein